MYFHRRLWPFTALNSWIGAYPLAMIHGPKLRGLDGTLPAEALANFFEMSAMVKCPGPRGAYENGFAKMGEAQVIRSPCAEDLGSSHPPSIDSQYPRR